MVTSDKCKSPTIEYDTIIGEFLQFKQCEHLIKKIAMLTFFQPCGIYRIDEIPNQLSVQFIDHIVICSFWAASMLKI